MSTITDHLRTGSTQLAPLEALHAAPDVLLGVSADAVTALAAIDVASVFDLAYSRVFRNAALLTDAADNPRAVFARYGLAPADVLDALPAGLAIEDLPRQPIGVLDGVAPAAAVALSDALPVQTVRDLALWPPYLAARDIVQRVLTPEAAPDADPEAPADLLPRSGEFPTERVFYSTLVFDGVAGEQPNLKALETAGAVDLAPVAGLDFGFKKPGIGALLTFAQSWFPQGVSLGQLLHSVALAPGESTRLAMIDWSRRSTGKQDEQVEETERLSNVTEHSRALSEVTSAVASEAQSGFSQTEADAASQQSGSAGGFSAGPITLGDSSGSAASHSRAMSFSSSSGRRDLGASMTQNVVDRTQQQANAARNRRATVVREVSDTEHESISTRVVTNYNHMHALSVQYYEVVQIYRVTVQLRRAERCLFVPMQMVDFRNANLVRMFRKVLLAAAIDEDAKALLATDLDTVELKAAGGAKFFLKNFGAIPAEVRDDGKTLRLPDEAKLTGLTVFRSRGGVNDLLPLTTLDVVLRDGTKGDIEKSASSGAKSDDIKVGRIPLREIDTVRMASPAAPNIGHDYSFTFTLSYKGSGVSFDIGIDVPPGPVLTALTVTGGGLWDRLVAHLEANRLHYSQAIYRNLDPASVTLLLSGYSYRGRPLSTLIDPQPVTTAGNYLVFRTHVTPDGQANDDEQREWAQWLEEHGVSSDQLKEDLVPLPSGGVFAEAVLGRYNSAEKLDLTRFWNWQDSPIPITAPEIAPIQAGGHTPSDQDLKAGGFSQPLVNIVSPTTLPDPAGLAPAFQAIANGNMFRDMSGLAATIGLAQAGLQTTSDAATAANVQAGSNMATAAKKEVEMFKAALAFAGAVMGAGSTDTSPSTISNDGAKINHGRSLDQRGVTGGSSGGAPGPAIGNGGTGASGGGKPTTAGGADGGPTGGGNEEAAFNRSVWGSRGESGRDATRALLGFALDGGLDGGDGGAAVALDAGPYAKFVTANRLDLEIADLLRELDGYPADSWAKQMATFAYHELDVNNLLGIFSAANKNKAKAVTPAANQAEIDPAAAGIGNGVTIDHIGGPGAWKGVTLLADSLVQAGKVPGPGRRRLAEVLTHELTHFRNRDFFVPLATSSPADHPTFYVDIAKANAHPKTAERLWYVMGEMVCNHVAWRVHQDLVHKANGTPIPANPSPKGFYRSALALDASSWPDNGYLADLKAAGTYNRQIAEWLQKVGGANFMLFHDNASKNTAVRQFFKDVYDAVQPAFAKPTEAPDGTV